MGNLGDLEEPRECFEQTSSISFGIQADATRQYSRGVQRQHQHSQKCISAVFDFIFACFGLRSDAAADERREESATGNLNARAVGHQQQHEEHLTNLSELPSREEFPTGNLIARSAGYRHEQEEHLTNMSELPKKCIKLILSFTTPRDVCRSAAVSTLFRSAANSDSVWNKFIPQQCYQIRPTDGTFGLITSKRELYFRLCDSILIDGGRKRFWLERSTAKIGYMLSARDLYIIWGDNQRHWRWISRNNSRFEEIAELLSVCWLDVGGRMDRRLLSPDTDYKVVFVLKFGGISYGWDSQRRIRTPSGIIDARPIKFSVKTPGEEEMEFDVHLLPMERRRIKRDGWMEVVAGEFRVRAAEDIGDDSSHIGFRMKEVESNLWKGGLLIDGVKIEPESTQHTTEPAQPWTIPVSVISDATTDDSSEESTMGDWQEGNSRNLSELPKECIRVILSFTTPRDVCRLSAVSKRFRSAANSNFVWNKFIPSQCYQIQLDSTEAVSFTRLSSKRELYFRLCDSILIDGGRKRFWLERSTAKIGFMLSARELYIINERYWRWVSLDDSRFDELAELLSVCWLEVGGKMNCRLLSPDTEYRVVFMLKFTEDSYGWRGQPLNFLVYSPEGEEITSEQLLVEKEGVANDGWKEVVAAEFAVGAAEDIQDDDSFSLSFRMTDVTSGWKGGLLIDGVKIEPYKSI